MYMSPNNLKIHKEDHRRSVAKKQWNHINSHGEITYWSMTREARIYNGEKTISLTSDAGKTGQQLLKNETRTLSNTIHKNKLEMD